ncbi:MAG TPA: FAD-dependent oxidoreductase [Polyangiaceae bacterium]|nr:FAD-dependent oxidoreductase [Polyangiaceae bacterium]
MGAAVELVREAPAQAERFDVIVIGGGQAGLSVGYYLARQGLRFVILDAEERVGDVWRKRWDSLRLFTPARFDALVGMPFPAPPDSFPTHTEMADYLEAYARRFQLPVQNRMRVESLRRHDGRYVVVAGGRELTADQVVVAMASYQKPRMPGWARSLSADTVQLHSSAYKNPEQLREGPVLLAGAGNSGAEIAIELVRRGHEVLLAGRSTGEAPIRINSFWGRLLGARLLLRFVFHRLLTIKTPMGRKARPKILRGGTPLIRTRRADLAAAGVRAVARVAGVQDGRPLLEDGRALDVSNVIWCTGFEPGFSWIDLPIFDDQGAPRHDGGVVADYPGLYFVGLNFLYSMSSSMIHGVGRDAQRITSHVAAVRGLV